MSSTLWQERWTLGIDVMDEEHQCLVRALDTISARFASQALPQNDMSWLPRYVMGLPGQDDMATRGEHGRGTQGADGRGGSVMDARECAPLKEHQDLIAALEELADLAREHFRHEEDLMRAINYPDLAAHRSEHALLLAEFVEMVRDLERQSITQLDADTLMSLHHWLVGHMVGADKDYADYYFSLLEEADRPIARFQSEGELV